MRLWIALLPLVGTCSGQDARCIFYRESALAGKALHASIRIDGETPMHKLGSGRYWETDVASGEYRIYSDLERYGPTYRLEPGQTYYFRVEFRTNPPVTFGKMRFQIVPVETSIATGEMSPLKADKR